QQSDGRQREARNQNLGAATLLGGRGQLQSAQQPLLARWRIRITGGDARVSLVHAPATRAVGEVAKHPMLGTPAVARTEVSADRASRPRVAPPRDHCSTSLSTLSMCFRIRSS